MDVIQHRMSHSNFAGIETRVPAAAKPLQLCSTLCDPIDGSPPGSTVPWDSPGKNTGMGCHFLLQGILPTQGSNPGLPHCRKMLYHLSHQGSPGGKGISNSCYYPWAPCPHLYTLQADSLSTELSGKPSIYNCPFINLHSPTYPF